VIGIRGRQFGAYSSHVRLYANANVLRARKTAARESFGFYGARARGAVERIRRRRIRNLRFKSVLPAAAAVATPTTTACEYIDPLEIGR